MGCIHLYKVDGESYLCFPNWGKHQRIQNKKSKYPAPDDGCSQEFTVDHGESPPESNPNPNPNPNTRDSSGEAAPPGANFTEFVSIYNEICTNLPQCKLLTEKRKRAIRAFCKQLSAEKWEEVCQLANSSPFCTGDNDKGWKADFDFLIRPDKATNVLEGRYCNERRDDGGGNVQNTHSGNNTGATGKWGIKSDLDKYLDAAGD